MKRLIFGCGDFSELLFANLTLREKENIAGFVVDWEFQNCETFCDKPVIAFDNLCQNYPPNEYDFYVAVGYTKMNLHRKEIFSRLHDLGYNTPNYIHRTAIVNATCMGDGNIFFPNVFVDAYVQMGRGNTFYSNSFLGHHSMVQDFNFFAVCSCICGHVVVGSNCYFGGNCTVKNGIQIADASLIGAGVYASNNTEVNTVTVSPRSYSLAGKTSFDFL